jgi:hypothetical protein
VPVDHFEIKLDELRAVYGISVINPAVALAVLKNPESPHEALFSALSAITAILLIAVTLFALSGFCCCGCGRPCRGKMRVANTKKTQ